MQFSIFAAALVAVLVGFGGTLAVIVQAAQHVGASPAQTASWVAALCLAIAGTSIALSLRYRIPVVTAWSLAGAALVASAPPGIGLQAATGAFLAAAVLTILSGLLPALGGLIARLPPSIAGAMLAGVLLRYVLGVFQAAQGVPALVLPLLAVFLAARMVHAASAPLVVIGCGVALAWALGLPMAMPGGMELSVLVPVMPSFDPAAILGLGVPLFLVTMATQQIAGAAVLRLAGYVPPVRGAACFRFDAGRRDFDHFVP